MSDEMGQRIAAIIRHDLAEEAAAGFPLLRRFPNSATSGIPAYFANLNRPEQDALLDALAHYSVITWSHEVVREKKAHPIFGPYLARQPSYPDGDWYGERPKTGLLKKRVVETLERAGYTPRKRESKWQRHVAEFTHPDPSFAGYMMISFEPGLMRQLDFGLRNWMRAQLRTQLPLLGPREFIPIVHSLSYDHLWHGAGTNNPVCCDLITEGNLEETLALFVAILDRLTMLAGHINKLAFPHRTR
jgi:hypothetical protein